MILRIGNAIISSTVDEYKGLSCKQTSKNVVGESHYARFIICPLM
jgi:hypothetical protein